MRKARAEALAITPERETGIVILTGVQRLCRNLGAVPAGTRLVPLLLPGTAVPGFRVLPLRGWSHSGPGFLFRR